MRYIEAKSILGARNNVNIYRGCTHGCIYCDSRSLCYQVGPFENIAIKKNAINIFKEEIKKKRKKGIISTGGMSDPYLPLEKDLFITRRMLEIIRDNGFGLSILTKSDLILRDIDIIETIHKNYNALVCMTITTFDDDLCKKIERNVTVTSKRFACLEEFAKRNIPTGIWLTPILPFINDTEENLVRIVKRCAEIGIHYIVVFGFGTTKRAGSEEYFYQCLDRYFPGLKQKYQKTYGNAYECPSLNEKHLWDVFKKLCDEYDIIYDLGTINQIISKKKEHMEQLSLFDETF